MSKIFQTNDMSNKAKIYSHLILITINSIVLISNAFFDYIKCL